MIQIISVAIVCLLLTIVILSGPTMNFIHYTQAVIFREIINNNNSNNVAPSNISIFDVQLNLSLGPPISNQFDRQLEPSQSSQNNVSSQLTNNFTSPEHCNSNPICNSLKKLFGGITGNK